MKILFNLALGILIIFPSTTVGQKLTKIEGQQIVTETELFRDEKGNLWGDYLILKFKGKAFETIKGKRELSESDIKGQGREVALFARNFNTGKVSISRLNSELQWGDTKRKHRRTDEWVTIKDLSQVVKLTFPEVVNLDSLKKVIVKFPGVEWVDKPQIITLLSDYPNDPYFTNGSLWHLDRIEAQRAWKITRGNSDVNIAIKDAWDTSETHPIEHEELSGKFSYKNFNLSNNNQVQGHGAAVASVAAGNIDNNKGIAGIGGKSKLMAISWYSNQVPNWESVDKGADVVNMSYTTDYNHLEASSIYNGLVQGVVFVAGAGNWIYSPSPSVSNYPAGYWFPSINAGVISVGEANQNDEWNDQGYRYYNYSTVNNPNDKYKFSDDSTKLIIHLMANARAIWMIEAGQDNSWSSYPNGYRLSSGTSYAAPQVSGLAALLLDINPDATPKQVLDWMIEGADKVGNYPYNYYFPSPSYVTPAETRGWEPHQGYGRINAYKTLLAALDDFPTTITGTRHFRKPLRVRQNVTIANGATLILEAGVTLVLDSGVTITVEAGGKIISNGNSSSPVRFMAADSATPWGHIHLKGNNNVFNWTVFEEGTSHVLLTHGTTGNIFTHCTFQNGYNRIATGNYNSGGSLRLENCMIRNNSSVGINLYRGSLTGAYNTIKHNGSAGIYVQLSTINDFVSNRIEFNGQGSTRDGIEVWSQSNVYLAHAYGGVGRNIIQNNSRGQIKNSGGYVFIGDWNYGGENAIIGANWYKMSTNNYISAYRTYWHDADLSWMFTGGGYVNRSYALGYNPTSSAGVNEGNYARKAVSVGIQDVDWADSSKIIQHIENSLESIGTDVSKESIEELIVLAGIINGSSLSTEVVKLNKAIEQKFVLFKENNSRKSFQETDIAVSKVRWLVQNAKFEEAILEFEKQNESIKLGLDKTGYLEIESQRKKGIPFDVSMTQFSKRLKKQGFTEAEIESAVFQEKLHYLATYNPHEIPSAVFSRQKQVSKTSDTVSSNKETPSDSADELEFEIYPNPFNPISQIYFTLKKQAFVQAEIFDISGRKIATLANQMLAAGNHHFQIDGTSWSTGLYILHVHIGEEVFSRKLNLIK